MGNTCSSCQNNKKRIRPHQHDQQDSKKLNYNQIQKYETFTYLEQRHYLKWLGIYGQNNQKVGNWTAAWNGVILDNVGGQYSEDGKKKGQWKELAKMFWKNGQVYMCGEYCDDIKNGKWIYIYDENQIGGGSYNKQGLKNGRWIDLSDKFQGDSQITYNGEYKNGKKIGNWDLSYRRSNQFEKIGGGSYNESGEEIKFGKWIEQSEVFRLDSQVIYNGQYKNGKKVGRWEVLYRKQYENEFKQIGGGLYDEEGSEIKLGFWIEVADGFGKYSEFTYQGEYQKGKKVGRWDIWYKKPHSADKSEWIGGGSYNEADQVQFGSWIEVSSEFNYYSQITYNGDYLNGTKIGRWDILYRKQYENQFKQIGGGQYNNKDGNKLGDWVEVSNQFSFDSQVIYSGKYLNGKKIGIWDIMFRRSNQFEKIGGGQYNESGDEIKFGNWIEQSEGFKLDSQVIYNGQYKNGKKVGKWEVLYRKQYENEFKQIGGGLYDEDGSEIKLGRWIELFEEFKWDSQIIYTGEYQNGNKVGQWDVMYRGQQEKEFKQIGGGSYDEEGTQIKQGLWTELSDDFLPTNCVVKNGEYQCGKKVGKWTEIDIQNNQKGNELKI
ncbi:unnamed protein product [Paramecium octaurelia]|uniref:Uncharacterized protein n=1 Tax=Paramecium octaurelia TaxID=43137 RepID=A0A8S1WR10_PAROT|nr:unnamed protein product [Paramecium octaurelia]